MEASFSRQEAKGNRLDLVVGVGVSSITDVAAVALHSALSSAAATAEA